MSADDVHGQGGAGVSGPVVMLRESCFDVPQPDFRFCEGGGVSEWASEAAFRIELHLLCLGHLHAGLRYQRLKSGHAVLEALDEAEGALQEHLSGDQDVRPRQVF